MRQIATSNAPTPAGHYSQAIVHAGFVFVSGQLPIDPSGKPRNSNDPIPDIESQVLQTLANIEAILLAAGSTPAQIVRCTVYVSDIAHWPRVNAAYAAYFSRHTSMPPARSVVPCGALHYGYQVEIDVIAACE